MKRKKYFLLAMIISVILLIGIIIMISKSDFIKIAFVNHYNLAELNQIFISSTEKNMMLNIARGNSIEKEAALQNNSSDAYQINDTFYLDYIDQNNSHIIIIYKNDVFTKYIAKSSYFIQNLNNRMVKKVELNFQPLVMQGADNPRRSYIDPLLFEEKKQVSEEAELIWIEKCSKKFSFRVYETMDKPEYSREKYVLYPKGTPSVVIAIHNQTTVSTVYTWFSLNLFDSEGMLLEDQLMCTEKYVSFQYGRQVMVRDLDTQDERLVIDLWETGEQRLYLQTTFLLNKKENWMGRETIVRPEAMDLCDAYFKEKAKEILEQTETVKF